MQRLIPQLIRSDNPMERQIIYVQCPIVQSSLLQEDPYYPSPSQESYIEETEEETYTELSSIDKDDYLPISPEASNKHMALRASTAPARPLTDIEEFRRSSDFLLLEHTVMCASQLIQRSDDKYDLDSEEGQRSCKKFLNQIERQCEVFKVKCASRLYRSEFSHAYRVLYKENSLCYLTEILDSAQEGFPYLWVNSERYVFSQEVLEAGSHLFNSFCKIQHILRDIYNRICEETQSGTVELIVSELRHALKEFDTRWVDFEQLYVHELMLIETDARRYITDAIGIERNMILTEVREKAKGRIVLGSNEYNEYRARLVELIGKINSVANIDGKGRDDLTVDILSSSEGIIRRISSVKSRAVINLAESIRQSFLSLRMLFRKYEHNIEAVDPQLKNNSELVEALTNFEQTWEKGKIYIQNSKRCAQLIYFSNFLDQLGAKYPVFKEQVECRDAELFISIPGLLILQCLENCDKDICRKFYPPMFDDSERISLVWKRLKRSYGLGKLASSTPDEHYELLEWAIIGLDIPRTQRIQTISRKFDNLDSTLHKIKTLAIELQRYKPSDWNLFLDILLG